ncbi:hypothetical protein GF354_06455 [Candidatus Peregrinibacteria bacterium]|nr:hypothetical protein [Candidatus Peregrinibacteria bacterium]
MESKRYKEELKSAAQEATETLAAYHHASIGFAENMDNPEIHSAIALFRELAANNLKNQKFGKYTHVSTYSEALVNTNSCIFNMPFNLRPIFWSYNRLYSYCFQIEPSEASNQLFEEFFKKCIEGQALDLTPTCSETNDFSPTTKLILEIEHTEHIGEKNYAFHESKLKKAIHNLRKLVGKIQSEQINQNLTPNQVFHLIRQQSGKYSKHTHELTKLLSNGKGNCEAYAKLTGVLILELFKEEVKYTAENEKIQVYLETIRYTNSPENHIRTIAEYKGKLYIFERNGLEVLDAKDKSNLNLLPFQSGIAKSYLIKIAPYAHQHLYTIKNEELSSPPNLNPSPSKNNTSHFSYHPSRTIEAPSPFSHRSALNEKIHSVLEEIPRPKSPAIIAATIFMLIMAAIYGNKKDNFENFEAPIIEDEPPVMVILNYEEEEEKEEEEEEEELEEDNGTNENSEQYELKFKDEVKVKLLSCTNAEKTIPEEEFSKIIDTLKNKNWASYLDEKNKIFHLYIHKIELKETDFEQISNLNDKGYKTNLTIFLDQKPYKNQYYKKVKKDDEIIPTQVFPNYHTEYWQDLMRYINQIKKHKKVKTINLLGIYIEPYTTAIKSSCNCTVDIGYLLHGFNCDLKKYKREAERLDKNEGV